MNTRSLSLIICSAASLIVNVLALSTPRTTDAPLTLLLAGTTRRDKVIGIMSMQVACRRAQMSATTTSRLDRTALVPKQQTASSSRAIPTRHVACRAEPDKQSPESLPNTPAATQERKQPQQPPAAEPSAPLLKPGQGTAIVTGAISVVFGIAYLVLVQLLDLRGGELQPPPPEAYIP